MRHWTTSFRLLTMTRIWEGSPLCSRPPYLQRANQAPRSRAPAAHPSDLVDTAPLRRLSILYLARGTDLSVDVRLGDGIPIEVHATALKEIRCRPQALCIFR